METKEKELNDYICIASWGDCTTEAVLTKAENHDKAAKKAAKKLLELEKKLEGEDQISSLEKIMIHSVIDKNFEYEMNYEFSINNLG